MRVVVAHLPGVLEAFLRYICDACARQEPKRRGVKQTHIWYIIAIDCNAPAFLTPDKKLGWPNRSQFSLGLCFSL